MNSATAARDFCQLRSHTAAAIEDHGYRNRRIFRREMRDHLLDLVFKQFEMVLFQPRDQAVVMVGDHHRNQDQIRISRECSGSVRSAFPVASGRAARPRFYGDYGILRTRLRPARNYTKAGVRHRSV